MFSGKAERKIRELFNEQIKVISESLTILTQTVEAFINDDEDIAEYSFRLHNKEHEADEIRRQIESVITEGAFLPFYREDYQRLADLIDDAADRAVGVAQALVLQKPEFPKELHSDFLKLARQVEATFIPFKQIASLFDKPEEAEKLCLEVSKSEQECDSIEWKLLKKLYAVEGMDRAEQLLSGRIIQLLSRTADAIENAADRVQLVIIKQKA